MCIVSRFHLIDFLPYPPAMHQVCDAFWAARAGASLAIWSGKEFQSNNAVQLNVLGPSRNFSTIRWCEIL